MFYKSIFILKYQSQFPMYFKARIILIIGILSFCVLFCQNKGDFSSNNNSSPLDTVKNDIKLSLAEWSLHKALFDKEITHLEFISTAKKLGFEGVEYVNQFFKDKVNDVAYLDSMNSIASQNNIKQLLIMVDGEGYLADADSTLRNLAVENHIKWLQAAKHLGCASIRVNAHGEGTAQEVAQYAIDGLKKLSSRAQEFGINVIVENHGGFSSNGQ